MKKVFMGAIFYFITNAVAFTQGTDWGCATDSAQWHGRAFHSAVVFDNKMWIIGGGYGGGEVSLNDVWYSTDGVNWVCAVDSAEWIPRWGHTSVVFDGKIWVMGGSDGYSGLNDVWYSSNGTKWVRATSNAQWSTRAGHSITMFDNKIWIIGGIDYNVGFKNDVWYSADGINLVCATDSAQWTARCDHSTVAFGNKIWVIGGIELADIILNLKNDVWHSVDGVSWACTTSAAEWTPREGHTSVVFDDKIWVMGGCDDPNFETYANDVWHSRDGFKWVCATDSAQWTPRYRHTSLVFNDKMWLMGGEEIIGGNIGYPADVWYSTIEGITENDVQPAGIYLSITPVIARDYVKIRYKDGGDIKMFNIVGNMVRDFTTVDGKDEIILELNDNYGKELPQGIYFIQLKTQTNTEKAKLIIIR